MPAATKGGYYAQYRQHPLALSAKGAGVIYQITKLLATAARGRHDKKTNQPAGITREALHKKLIAHFPDRDVAKMWTTVNNQVPSRLRLVRGLDVRRNENTGGYYLVGDAPKPVKTAPAKGKK